MRSKGVGLVLIIAIGIIDERAFQFSPEHEISVVSAVLKKYCRELPEPIFYFPLADRIRYTENRGKYNSCCLDLAVTDSDRLLKLRDCRIAHKQQLLRHTSEAVEDAAHSSVDVARDR
jgi:hypothetical protein